MATHLRFHPHPHTHSHTPISWFAWEHPYAGEWLILALVTLAALLLWHSNS